MPFDIADEMNAIRLSTQAIQNQINQIICQEIQRANARLAAGKQTETIPTPA